MSGIEGQEEELRGPGKTIRQRGWQGKWRDSEFGEKMRRALRTTRLGNRMEIGVLRHKTRSV